MCHLGMVLVLIPKIAPVCALKATSTCFTAINQNTKQNIQSCLQSSGNKVPQTKLHIFDVTNLGKSSNISSSKWLLVKSTWFWVDCEKSANWIRESDYEMVCKWPVDAPWPCHLRQTTISMSNDWFKGLAPFYYLKCNTDTYKWLFGR